MALKAGNWYRYCTILFQGETPTEVERESESEGGELSVCILSDTRNDIRSNLQVGENSRKGCGDGQKKTS